MYRRKRPKSNNGISKTLPRSYKAEETVFSNVDLVEEILARVPAMSLMRLKCVSKQWLTLISNPQFVSHHTRTHTKPSISGLYLFKQYQPFKDVSLSCHTSTPSLSYFQNEKGVESLVTVADSCNGLLWCCYNYIRKHYLVCNPTTRKYTLLPTPGPITANYRCEVLVFHPLKSPHYKVVLVSWCGELCQFDIYSSITSSWKQLHAPTPKNNIACPCVYWEGEVHWVMNSAGKNFHCRFKVDTEELEVIKLDSELRIHNGDKIRYFGRSGKSFLRIQIYSPEAMEFKILETSCGQRRWRVKHTVSLKYAFPRGVNGSVEGLFSLVDILHGEKEGDLELVLAVRGKLVSYRIKSKTLKKITDLPVTEEGSYDPVHERMIEGFQFIESLAEVR